MKNRSVYHISNPFVSIYLLNMCLFHNKKNQLCFGKGMAENVSRRAEYYWSDFVDGMSNPARDGYGL